MTTMKFPNFSKLFMILMMLPLFSSITSCVEENDATAIPYILFENETETLTFDAEGSVETIKLLSNRGWTISIVPSDADWISINPIDGNGDKDIMIAIGENTAAAREATLVAKVEGSTTRKVTLIVKQLGEGGTSAEALYEENCGSNVYKINSSTGDKDDSGRWPYIDQYTQFFDNGNPWQKGGAVDQSGITYEGESATVSNSGAAFGPGNTGFSDAPYIGMNSSSAKFYIKGINTGNKSNFTFSFGALFQSGYSGSAQFGVINSDILKLYASVDGEKWASVNYSVGVPANNWALVTAEFKLPEGSEKLSLKFESVGIGANQGSRLDDFKLVEGGNGELLDLEGGDGGNGTDPEEGDKTFITVDELRGLYSGSDLTISDDVWVKATVISSKAGGNSTSLKNVIVSDGSKGIMVRFASNSEFALGDVVSIPLKGVKLTKYADLLQIDGAVNANVVVNGNSPIEPIAISVAQLLSNEFESMYVSVADVQVADEDLSKTVGNKDSHISINIVSANGDQFIMFTAKYATFINESAPQGSGSLKGIASINNGAIQIIPTVASDFASLTGDRFSTAPFLTLTSSAAVNVGSGADTKTINFSSNTAWTAVIVEGATANATLGSTSGNGNGSIAVSFSENDDTENEKTATVRITSATAGVAPVEVVFTQSMKSTASDAAGLPATWNFNTSSVTNNILSATDNTNAFISVIGANDLVIAGNDPKKYLNSPGGWDSEVAAWLITIPVVGMEANTTVNITYSHYSSKTGPKDFTLEYSSDKSNWTTVDEYELVGAAYLDQSVDMTISDAIASGNLYIRIRKSSNDACNGSPVASGGTNRLASGSLSVTQK